MNLTRNGRPPWRRSDSCFSNIDRSVAREITDSEKVVFMQVRKLFFFVQGSGDARHRWILRPLPNCLHHRIWYAPSRSREICETIFSPLSLVWLISESLRSTHSQKSASRTIVVYNFKFRFFDSGNRSADIMTTIDERLSAVISWYSLYALSAVWRYRIRECFATTVKCHVRKTCFLTRIFVAEILFASWVGIFRSSRSHSKTSI
jgi:hypothetical protein